MRVTNGREGGEMTYEVRGERGLSVEAGGQPSRVSRRSALERGLGRRLQGGIAGEGRSGIGEDKWGFLVGV